MPTPGGFKDGRLYSLDNLPPLTYNKIWVGNTFGFPEEQDLPGVQTMTTVSHNGTVVGTQPVLNFIDGSNVTLTIANDTGTSSIDVTIAATGGGGGAPSNATYILTTADSGPLPNSFALGSLGTGILRNTTTTGVGALTIDTHATALANLTPNTGTLIYGSAGTWTSLGIGSNGQFLSISGGIPFWTAGGGGSTVNVTANSAGGGTASTINFNNGTGITFSASPPTSGIVNVSAIVSGGSGITFTDDGNVSPYRFFVGSTAGSSPGSGATSNTAIGIDVLQNLTVVGGTPTNNLGIGQGILNALTTGSSNIGIGLSVLNNLTVGHTNIAVGYSLLPSTMSTAASNNLIFGSNNLDTGTLNPTISSNILLGNSIFNSRQISANFSNNIIIGNGTPVSMLTFTSVQNCIFIGNNANSTQGTINNSVGIGPNVIVNNSNAIVLGNGINVGINQPAPAAALHISSSASADILLDNTINANIPPIPTNPGGLLYITSSTGTLADQLMFSSSSGTVYQLAKPIPISIVTTAGDLIYGTGAGAVSRLGIGTQGQLLMVNGSSLPSWGSRIIDTGTSSYTYFAGLNAGSIGAISGGNNVAVGIFVLDSLTSSGNNNVAIGQDLFHVLVDGVSNVGIGSSSANLLQHGTNNIIVGNSVLSNAVNVNNNIGIGSLTLKNLTSGNDNIAIGSGALETFVTPLSVAAQNIAIGSGALGASTGGTFNVALGYQALNVDDSEGGHTAIGYQAGMTCVGTTSSTGLNTFLGYQADVTTSLLQNVIAIGAGTKVSASNCANIGGGNPAGINLGINQPAPASVLHLSAGLTTGLVDIRLETSSIPTQTTTTGSIYVTSTAGTVDKLWFQAGSGSPVQLNGGGGGGIVFTDDGGTGLQRFFVGSTAGAGGVTGTNNTAIGIDVLNTVTTGAGNTILGNNNAQLLTTGGNNIVIGYSNFSAATACSNNIIMGYQALNTLTGSSSLNIVLGFQALQNSISGQQNTVLGSQALQNDLGNQSVAIGYRAGRTAVGTTGAASGNIFLGSGADVSSSTITNALAIGYNTVVSSNNSGNIGTSGGLNLGINKTTPLSVLHLGIGPTSGVNDLRFDSSSVLPTAHTGTASLFVRNSSGTLADQLFFQTGSGTNYQLSNPVTTLGDLIYGNGGSTLTRLGIGTTGQVLTVSGGLPAWATAPSIVYTDDGIVLPSNFFVGSTVGNPPSSITGANNTGLGISIFQTLIAGTGNTAVGFQSLMGSGDFSYNTAFGYNTLANVQNNTGTTGYYNTAVGYNALGADILGQGSTAIGYNAGSGYSPVHGTFLGFATDTLSSGLQNVLAIGSSTKVSASNCGNISGGNPAGPSPINLGINQSLPKASLHVGVGNIPNQAAIGIDPSISAPTFVSGLGQIYVTNSGGTNADLLWFQPGYSISPQLLNGLVYTDDGTGGLEKFFIGKTAGNNATTGANNTAIGIQVLQAVTTGQSNTAIGDNVFNAVTTGFENTGLGYNVGSQIVTGQDNTFIGFNATTTLGNDVSYCTLVGSLTEIGASATTNAGAFGYQANVNQDNAINIGNAANVGINNPTPIHSLHVSIAAVPNCAAIVMDNSTAIPTLPGGSTAAALYVTTNSGGSSALAISSPTPNNSGMIPALNNQTCGTIALGSGFAVVNTTAVNTNSIILLSFYHNPTTPGFLSSSNIVTSSSFDINSTGTTSNDTVAWLVLNPV